MAIGARAARPADRTIARFRGLELRVGDSTGLLPSLPLWVRRNDRGWEPVGHAVDRPAQIGGAVGAPWSRLSGLRLDDEGDRIRLSGLAEPGPRAFTLTASDPLGRWSEVRWLDASAPIVRPRRCPPIPTTRPAEGPGLIAWHDFADRGLDDDQWIGSEWPTGAWERDRLIGLLRPSGPGDRGTTRFIGLEVRHHELGIEVGVRVPDAVGSGGGLELHVDGVPLRVGVIRAPGGSMPVAVGGGRAIATLPASVTEVTLALVCGTSSFGLEVRPGRGPAIRHTFHRASGSVTAAGMYAEGSGAPVGFAWFEYRGGRSAIANRAGAPR